MIYYVFIGVQMKRMKMKITMLLILNRGNDHMNVPCRHTVVSVSGKDVWHTFYVMMTSVCCWVLKENCVACILEVFNNLNGSVRICIGFLLYIFPPTYIQPLWNHCRNTLEYFGNLSKNDTTNILDSYILLKNSLSQSEATEPSEPVASLSFNSPSESRSTLFGTCLEHPLGHHNP